MTSSRPGVPIGWTVSDSPFRHDEPLLVAESRGHRRRDEEEDQPEVGEERRHLRVLVAVAVDVDGPVVGADLADPEAAAADDAGQRPLRPTPVIAARSGSRGSKYGSGWTTRTSATPRHSRGVRSSVQTMIDDDERRRAPG